MPIDWGSRETIFRLLAAAFAVIGKEGFKGTYGEIARVFGEPATYDAIQCQFREVSKMADALRAGQAGTNARQKSVKAPRSVQNPSRASSNLGFDHIEVIAHGQENSAAGGIPGIYHPRRVNETPKVIQTAHSRNLSRPSPPPPSFSTPSEARTIPHNEELATPRPVLPASSKIAEPARLIPKVIITLDQVDRSQYPAVPCSSSADEVTASFEAELTARASATAKPNRAEDCIPRSAQDHAEERAQFRKLYSSDSYGNRAERIDMLLTQNSQEHAAERARYRNLYFPDQDKDIATPQNGISEVRCAASSAKDQAGPKAESSVNNAAAQHRLPSIAQFFGRNVGKDPRSSDRDEASSVVDETSNCAYNSYMDPETRKCLLCDGRRFPGEAFYKHELGSQRHRENLGNDQKVAEANARLERQKRRGSSKCTTTHKPDDMSLPPNDDKSVLGEKFLPPTQDLEQRSGERGPTPSTDQLRRSLSLPPNRQESVVSRTQLSSRATGKRAMQYANEIEVPESGIEDQSVGYRQAEACPLPLKRKRPVLEPEKGESSAPSKAKKAKVGSIRGKTHDDMLAQISGTILEKLLELDPSIFNMDRNARSSSASSGLLAVGQSTSSKLRRSVVRKAYRRRTHKSEELRSDAIRGGRRDRSENSPDHFQCSSRCDDSADSDYQDDGDQNDEVEDDEEDMIGQEEVDEDEADL